MAERDLRSRNFEIRSTKFETNLNDSNSNDPNYAVAWQNSFCSARFLAG